MGVPRKHLKMASARDWDPKKMFDISEAQKKALQERADMRTTMRKEWQMKSTSPYRGVGGYIFDPAIQRFASMRVSHFDHFKATPKTGAFAFATVVAPILFFWWRFEADRNNREAKFRSGQVAYRDRDYKFI